MNSGRPPSPFSRPSEALKRVSLMTLHSAKGLEFNTVFFVGFEDGLVPYIRCEGQAGPQRGACGTGHVLRALVSWVIYRRPIDGRLSSGPGGWPGVHESRQPTMQILRRGGGGDGDGGTDLEEEKRLAYVGVTRAMERLYLVTAEARSLFGSSANRKRAAPSRFLSGVLASGGAKVRRSHGTPVSPGSSSAAESGFDDLPPRPGSSSRGSSDDSSTTPRKPSKGFYEAREQAAARRSSLTSISGGSTKGRIGGIKPASGW